MNRMQAVKNLKRAYEKDYEEIIYLIEESKDGYDYNSLYELRLDVYEELEWMQECYRDFFNTQFYAYFDHQTGKLIFKECRPDVPLGRVFSKIDYETTETLLKNYKELNEIMRKEEIKQNKKLYNYFINLKF